MSDEMRNSIADMKRQLGIDHLLLQIHDGSFPVDPAEDCGRGSPYAIGAERFFAFAARLGFDGIQLGPQGRTERGNPSPYDSTLFSRNPLNLPLLRMVQTGRLSEATFADLQRNFRDAPQPFPQTQLDDAWARACKEIVQRASTGDRQAARAFLTANSDWLVSDALYIALCQEHQAPWWREWHRTPQGALDQRLFAPLPGEEEQARQRLASLRGRYAGFIEDYALLQLLLDREHAALRARLATLGLVLFADLQVGLAPQDAWARQALFLPGYRMGAPPSRTNPEGQPWGYPVGDPRKFGTLASPGPMLEFVRQRIAKVLAECDGVRIDHPHGWIDPWVYRDDDADPFHAVQHGARLFSSPRDPWHIELGDWAIARAEQIDVSVNPYADARVTSLDENQVAAYARLIDVIVEQLAAQGCSRAALACEVLSTLPYPIARVLERHGLGRFRVTQKLSLDQPLDVYRVENAVEQDWIMLGTHDTPSVWSLASSWQTQGTMPRWGTYLAGLLVPDSEAEVFAGEITGSAGLLIHALCAAMFASRARNVSIFFPDLFGITDRYNKPGIVDEENWRMRLPADFESFHENRVRAGQALDLTRCFQMALRARESRPRPA